MHSPEQAIGVFDSGVGGLSILNALRRKMPAERFVYFADSAHAPYGERGEAYVIERSRHVARMLCAEHGIKALVVACNTATAVAIHLLRNEFPDLIVIGVEPALKPAIQLSRTKRIAVIGTSATVHSQKFHDLHASLEGQAQFDVLACSGLAGAIEKNDQSLIEALCQTYLGNMNFGSADDQIDTLVLGCTHYPFVEAQMRRITGPSVIYVETGQPVANQTCRRLEQARLLAPTDARDNAPGLTLLSSGNAQTLQEMAHRFLAGHPTA